MWQKGDCCLSLCLSCCICFEHVFEIEHETNTQETVYKFPNARNSIDEKQSLTLNPAKQNMLIRKRAWNEKEKDATAMAAATVAKKKKQQQEEK